MGFTFFQFRGSADVKVEGITFERPDAAVDKLSAAFVFYDDGATDTTFSFINCTFRNFYIGIYGAARLFPVCVIASFTLQTDGEAFIPGPVLGLRWAYSAAIRS